MAKHQKMRTPKSVVPLKPIRRQSDFQADWEKYLERLRTGHFLIDNNREMHGDAPKDFLRVREYAKGKSSFPNRPQKWPAYIAKVGSKWYPIESVTEHLITRIGQVCEIDITDSRLCIVGKQARFLSRYFLDDSCERLVHGLDLFRRFLDEETILSIEKTPRERQEYTFQFVERCLDAWFPTQALEFKTQFVTMLGFDAFVGNNDRHPMNWGLIVPIGRNRATRFAPIFDSARGLFWNHDENKIAACIRDLQQLLTYVEKSQPQIGWSGWNNQNRYNHFSLIEMIVINHPEYVSTLRRFTAPDLIARCEVALEKEFASLLSNQRRSLIVQCLQMRRDRLAALLPQET